MTIETIDVTRESWLYRAAAQLETCVLEPKGLEAVEGLRLTVGWPSTGGTRAKKRVIGQCFPTEASKGGLQEIFISPTLGDAKDVLATLQHEMLHAIVGTKHKHDATFAKACKDTGLEGKPTATVAGEELLATYEMLLRNLPAYPHVELSASRKDKQSTRMLKVYCGNLECDSQAEGGFSFRTTRKWLDAYGLVRRDEDGEVEGVYFAVDCPACQVKMAVEGYVPLQEDKE